MRSGGTWLAVVLLLLLLEAVHLPWLVVSAADAQLPDLILGSSRNTSTYTFREDVVLSYRLIQISGLNTTLSGSVLGLTVTTEDLYLSSTNVVLAAGIRLIVKRTFVLAGPRVTLVDGASLVARSASTSVAVSSVVVGSSSSTGVANEGTLQVLTGVTLTLQTPLLNTGTIQLVSSSALVLKANAVHRGSITLCSSCTLRVEMPSAASLVSVEEDASASGDGQIAINLGTMVAAGLVRVGQVQVGPTQASSSQVVAFLQTFQPLDTDVVVNPGGQLLLDLLATRPMLVDGSLGVDVQGTLAVYNAGLSPSTAQIITGEVQLAGSVNVAIADGASVDLDPLNLTLLQFSSRTKDEPFLGNLTCVPPSIGDWYLQFVQMALWLTLVPTVGYSPQVVAVTKSTTLVGTASWMTQLAAGLNTTEAHVVWVSEQDGSATKRLWMKFAASSDQKAYDLAQSFLFEVAKQGAYATGLGIQQAYWASNEPSATEDDGGSGAVLIFLIVLAAVCMLVLCGLLLCWLCTRHWYRARAAKEHVSNVVAQVLQSSSFTDKQAAMIDDAMRTATVHHLPPIGDLDDDDDLSVANATVVKPALPPGGGFYVGPDSPRKMAPKLAAGEEARSGDQFLYDSFVFDTVDKPWQHRAAMAHAGEMQSSSSTVFRYNTPSNRFSHQHPGFGQAEVQAYDVSWTEQVPHPHTSPMGTFYIPYVFNPSSPRSPSSPSPPRTNPLSSPVSHQRAERPPSPAVLVPTSMPSPVMVEPPPPPRQKSESTRTSEEEDDSMLSPHSIHFLSPRSPQALRSHSSMEVPSSDPVRDKSGRDAYRNADTNEDALSSEGSAHSIAMPQVHTSLPDRGLLPDDPELATVRLRDLTSTRSLLDSNARFFSHLDAARMVGGPPEPYGGMPVVEVTRRQAQRLRTTTPVSPDWKGKGRAKRYVPPPVDDGGVDTFDTYVVDPGLPDRVARASAATSQDSHHPHHADLYRGQGPFESDAGETLSPGAYFDDLYDGVVGGGLVDTSEFASSSNSAIQRPMVSGEPVAYGGDTRLRSTPVVTPLSYRRTARTLSSSASVIGGPVTSYRPQPMLPSSWSPSVSTRAGGLAHPH